MINSFSKIANLTFDCDGKYTDEIDGILENMQQDGFEIIDVKFNSLKDQSLTGARTGFNTLITYR